MPIRLLIAAVSVLAAALLFSGKKKVFISYYYDKDRHYKRLLKAWSANKKFGLEFEDVSTDVSINSQDKNYIKQKIAERIDQCDVFLVCVGKESHEREWISWEINKAKEYKKKIVVVKAKKTYTSPKELLSAGAEWVYGFNEKEIRAAIEN